MRKGSAGKCTAAAYPVAFIEEVEAGAADAKERAGGFILHALKAAAFAFVAASAAGAGFVAGMLIAFSM